MRRLLHGQTQAAAGQPLGREQIFHEQPGHGPETEVVDLDRHRQHGPFLDFVAVPLTHRCHLVDPGVAQETRKEQHAEQDVHGIGQQPRFEHQGRGQQEQDAEEPFHERNPWRTGGRFKSAHTHGRWGRKNRERKSPRLPTIATAIGPLRPPFIGMPKRPKDENCLQGKPQQVQQRRTWENLLMLVEVNVGWKDGDQQGDDAPCRPS